MEDYLNDLISGTQSTAKQANPLAQAILGSYDPSKWTGAGYGSAQANAENMAEILNSIGITDIKQFGVVPKYEKVETQMGADGKPVYGTMDAQWYGSGDDGGYQEVFVPLADQSKVTVKDGQPVIQSGTTYGNKETGQAVPTTYGERQTDNAWGGTFEGKGNTGYRVFFDNKGDPHFYTTGASSNTLANMIQDSPMLGVVLNTVAATLGGPAGVAALAAAQGKKPEDILKAAALSYVGGQVGNTVTGAAGEALNADIGGAFGPDNIDVGGGWNPATNAASTFSQDALANLAAKTVGNAANQMVASGGKADLGAVLAGGALNTGVNMVANQIPGYDTLNPSVKTFVNSAISSTLQNGGHLSDQALMNAAVAAGMNAIKTAPTSQTGAAGTGPGYYDEATGKFVYDPNGPLQGPLTNETSGTTTVGDYTNVIRNDDGSTLIMDKDGNVIGSTPATDTIVTNGADILTNSGAGTNTGTAVDTKTTAPAIKATTGANKTTASTALDGLAGTAETPATPATPATTPAGSAPNNTSQYDPGLVELMDEIFGTNLFTPMAKPVSTNKTAKAATGGSVDDLLKLLRS